MIILLRDPISRSFSNYMHMVLTGRETLDFHSALLAEPARIAKGWGDLWRYQDHSLYCSRLQAMEEKLGPAQIHVVVTEELFEARLATVESVLDFLGVDPTITPRNLAVEYNRSADLPSGLGRRRISDWVRTAASWLPRRQREGLLNVYHLHRSKGHAQSSLIDPRAVEYLLERFGPEVERLRRHLGQPLAKWRQYN